MQIDSLMVPEGSSVNYDPAFRNVLEDHLTLLRNSKQAKETAVDPMQAYRFEGDYFGLLAHYGVEVYLHWITMRVNGLTSPAEASKDISSFILPSVTQIGQIRQSFMTANRIT